MTDRNAIRAACEAATPGPWIRYGCRRKFGVEDCIMVGPDGFAIVALPTGRRPEEHAGAFKDAAFIAMARTAVPELLDAVDALDAELNAVSRGLGPDCRFMDPPDGGDVSLSEQVRRMRDALEAAETRVKEAEGVLERIARPEYGIGFNRLRGIARTYFAVSQVEREGSE